MKTDYRRLFGKVLVIALAGIAIGVGVGIILYANVGGDTVTVFQDGLHDVFDISYGQASRLYNIVLIILAIILARKNFGIGTIISALIVGYVIDFTNDSLVALGLDLSFIVRLVIFLVGQTVYSLGLALLIKFKVGMNALDSLLYRLEEVTRIEYKKLRIVADLLLTVVGFILGGVVGIGTLISIVVTGLMIDLFVRVGSKDR